MKTITIKNKTAKELRVHLSKELALFKEIDNHFKKKYKMTLTQLEQKIKTEGVPVKKHTIWEDSIEWRNAVEEAKNSGQFWQSSSPNESSKASQQKI